MKLKKLITGMLLILILVAQIAIIPFNNLVYAQETENVNNTKFHYQQLDDLAKNVYNGIYDMYVQGILKTGTGKFDLAEADKYVTQEQLENYMKGNTELKDAMNAARYAFYADYPEVFYVNFSILTIRVTKDAQNRYHANIGSGNRENYYVEGFTNTEQVESEIRAFEDRVNEIVESARNLTIEEGKNLQTEQIKYVHNEIINNTSYRLESDCTEGNEAFIGTPYGALVKKQAVCEGYARALKTVLDKLGMNNILVQGTHQTDGLAEVPHMWNYVEVEKQTYTRATQKAWYAIDATLDDPFLRNENIDINAPEFEPGDDLTEGFENTRYCLVGIETMRREHVALETVEAAGNYTFHYPELNMEDFGIDTVTNINGLVVKYKQDGTETEEYKSGDYYVSYNGKGYVGAAEEGKYMLMRSHYYLPGDEKWQISKWAYFLPDVYAGGFKDYGDHIYLYVPNSEYVEFAVTTLAPGDYVNNPIYLAYQGDETDFVAQTGKLYNPSGTYKARPYVKTQTPPATTTLSIGPTYHVEATFDDDLVLTQGITEAGYRIESSGLTGAEKSEITNFVFDGKRKVTFDLKFSEMYADDGANYRIYTTGLVGKNSGKEPMPITFGAQHDILCAYRMNQAKNWEVFGRPTLLETEDLSMKDWQTSDGTPVSDLLRSRITLVTTRTTQTEKNTMENLVENALGEQELVTSETYNISLNVCKKYVVKTGHRLRVALGFPAGYGPDDAGVTFKAYHFKRDAQGNVTGVEEIPCVITQYGLIITCDSFSPFAIAVVEADETAVNTTKTAIVSTSEGGLVTGANREDGNILQITENESKTIGIQAEEGYQIERVTVGGEVKEITNNKTMDLTIGYDDLKDGNGIVDVSFIAETVVAEDVKNGETAVQPTALPANVTDMPSDVNAKLNKTLTIIPTVEEVEGVLTYQWYKNGEKLATKISKVLTIENAKETDAGEYTLKVTNTVGTTSVETTSQPCNVTVTGEGLKVTIDKTDANVDLTTLKAEDEFEVTVSLHNIASTGRGLISLGGQLEYDTNLLERISVTGQNGWKLDNNSFNVTNFKFITDNNNLITEDGAMFKIRFMVKDTIDKTTDSMIKLKGISASGGDGKIVADDAQIAIRMIVPVGITSDKYKVEEQTISRIAPNTTVATFKQNINYNNQELVFTDKNGNVLSEDSLLGTGAIVKINGSDLQYTLIVIGDIDGDAEISVNDLGMIKLHFIDYQILEGNSAKAADVDGDGEITINDIAQIKLVLINLMEIK